MNLNQYKKVYYVLNRFLKLFFFSIFYYRQVNIQNNNYKNEIKKLKKKNKKIINENIFLKKKIKIVKISSQKKEKLLNKILNL
jgi:cell division protein FtsB